ncbi:hypothetical protein FDG2_3370 [Candidatus Protofrankia californiensis]|uniref:Uncharacterized protein n=1 Tax=Candidatus Protofrankia californiensis TaxID=1839754 RepID=A0A1C3NZL6_9ACTN|nr:hypothetical protein FDG2_3370 [Candidatus Protofrankia californiensis]
MSCFPITQQTQCKHNNDYQKPEHSFPTTQQLRPADGVADGVADGGSVVMTGVAPDKRVGVTGAAAGLEATIGCTVRAAVGVAAGVAAGMTPPNEVGSVVETAAGDMASDDVAGWRSRFMDPVSATDGSVSAAE